MQKRKHQTIHTLQGRKIADLQTVLEQHSRQGSGLVRLSMENFSLNSAKSFLGRNVNLHLKDGSVIVNVQLTGIRKGNFGKGNFIEYIPYGNRKVTCVPLRNIAWAEMLNLHLMETAG
jgi:hypothetical protein